MEFPVIPSGLDTTPHHFKGVVFLLSFGIPLIIFFSIRGFQNQSRCEPWCDGHNAYADWYLWTSCPSWARASPSQSQAEWNLVTPNLGFGGRPASWGSRPASWGSTWNIAGKTGRWWWIWAFQWWHRRTRFCINGWLWRYRNRYHWTC